MGKGKYRHLIIALISTVAVLYFAVQNSNIAAASDEKLVVGVPADRCPVFYIDEETGEEVGIGVDLIKLAAKNAGYEVEIRTITENNLKDALDNESYDIVMPYGSVPVSASGKAAIVSDNLSETPFTLLTDEKHPTRISSGMKIGMLNSYKNVAEVIQEKYPNIEIVFYEDMSESISNLYDGEVDALLNNSYVWSYILQKPSYKDLHVQPAAMFSLDFKAGVLDTPKGRDILSRLNKGIAQIDDTNREAIILDYTTRRLYKYTLGDYWYMYRSIIILGSLLFYAILIIIIMNAWAYRQKQD